MAASHRFMLLKCQGGRSGTIKESQVLVGLSIATVEEALKRSLTEDDSAIARWLLQTFTVLPT